MGLVILTIKRLLIAGTCMAALALVVCLRYPPRAWQKRKERRRRTRELFKSAGVYVRKIETLLDGHPSGFPTDEQISGLLLRHGIHEDAKLSDVRSAELEQLLSLVQKALKGGQAGIREGSDRQVLIEHLRSTIRHLAGGDVTQDEFDRLFAGLEETISGETSAEERDSYERLLRALLVLRPYVAWAPLLLKLVEEEKAQRQKLRGLCLRLPTYVKRHPDQYGELIREIVAEWCVLFFTRGTIMMLFRALGSP